MELSFQKGKDQFIGGFEESFDYSAEKGYLSQYTGQITDLMRRLKEKNDEIDDFVDQAVREKEHSKSVNEIKYNKAMQEITNTFRENTMQIEQKFSSEVAILKTQKNLIVENLNTLFNFQRNLKKDTGTATTKYAVSIFEATKNKIEDSLKQGNIRHTPSHATTLSREKSSKDSLDSKKQSIINTSLEALSTLERTHCRCCIRHQERSHSKIAQTKKVPLYKEMQQRIIKIEKFLNL